VFQKKKMAASSPLTGVLLFSSPSSIQSNHQLTINREKILGKGKYGIVYEGVWGETKVAVKRIPIDNAASSKGELNMQIAFDHKMSSSYSTLRRTKTSSTKTNWTKLA
jgi:hypothetical protein